MANAIVRVMEDKKRMKTHKHSASSVVLPASFQSMLAGDPSNFIVRMEGERVILEPKGAKPYNGPDRRKGNGAAKPSKKETANRAAAILTEAVRPKFRYSAKDKRMTPESAAKYGLSPTRLKVYKTIYGAKTGLLAKDIMAKCKLPHGSVQQTLNWLRNHRFVAHEILPTK